MSVSSNVIPCLAAADRILLILDYDGTLSPIVERPSEAILPPPTREVLIRLNQFSSMHLCVMSGRSLSDLKKRVGVPGIIYVGNHGLEAEGMEHDIPGLDRPRTALMMSSFTKLAEKSLQDIQGVIIDNKGLTVSIHYRMVGDEDVSRVRSVVETLVSQNHNLRITYGKKVLEVRSKVQWDKGTMARMLFELMRIAYPSDQTLPIYIGDDTTDEDAFISLSGVGVTIVVSDERRETSAEFRVKGTEDVLELLEELNSFLRKRSTESGDLSSLMEEWSGLQGH